MSEHIGFSILMTLAAFVLGWIGSEGYQFYKDSKDKRWR